MTKFTLSGVDKACDKLIRMNEAEFNKCTFIVGVSRGGLIPASIIATKLNKPLVAAYIDKQDNVYLDRADWLGAQNVIVVDDAVRTGKTMSKIMELVAKSTAPYIVHGAVLFKGRNCPLDVMASKTAGGTVLFPWDKNDQTLN